MPPAEAHVLLFPEDIQSESPIDSVVYGTVISTRDGVATIGLLSAPHTEVRVPHTLVRERRVDPTEFSSGAVGEWMRKAVVGVDGDRYVYGQVVSYDDDTVTIRTAADFVTVGTEDLQEVAPVLCFLLAHSDKTVDVVTPDELANHHVAILDRLLGISTAPRTRSRSQSQPVPVHATRSIQRLLATFLPSRIHPRGTDTRPWINMFTGEEKTVSCQHAINFAHFVDGNNRASPTMQQSLGSSFDDDPSQRVESMTSHTTAPPPPSQLRAQALSPRVSRTDPTPTSVPSQPSHTPTDPAAEIEALLHAVASSSVPPSTIHPTRLPPPSTNDDTRVADNHAKILAAIADNPSLVRFYLSSCQPMSAKHAVPADDHRPTQRRRLDGPSDLIYGDDATVRRPKHAFAPTRVQQAINDLISAADHSGKDPTSLADSMLSSRATKFKPHPAIIARVYAFEFGARGLSIMHFSRFDFAARRAWYAAASVNLNNFGPTVSLPRATRPVSLDDIAGALTVLHVFTEEFMDSHTCRLVSSAREFVEELRSYCRWGPQDVETLTFWFDTLFESYRTAAEHDTRHGSSTRSHVRTKLSLQDPDLQSVLYVIQSERLANLSRPPQGSHIGEYGNRSDQSRQPDQSRPNDQFRSNRPRPPPRTPREVIDALPRQGRLTVCMKYLSARGCVSKSDDRCAFPNHAHFIPEDLPPVVRQHITENMGTVTAIRTVLRNRLNCHEATRRNRLVAALSAADIAIPTALKEPQRGPAPLALDQRLCTAISSLVTTNKLSLAETIALWRGESLEDQRPNKALDPVWLDILLHGYVHRTAIVDTAKEGVAHTFIDQRVPDETPVRNHGSAQRYDKALCHSLAEGQAAGTYLIVDTTVALRWGCVRYSPFGCVPKNGVDPKHEARLIHDLSFPRNQSINAQSNQDQFPTLEFDAAKRIAIRIECLARRHNNLTTKMLKGDVKSAFHHVPVSSSVAAHLAGSHQNVTAIDLALPFGWTGQHDHKWSWIESVTAPMTRL